MDDCIEMRENTMSVCETSHRVHGVMVSVLILIVSFYFVDIKHDLVSRILLISILCVDRVISKLDDECPTDKSVDRNPEHGAIILDSFFHKLLSLFRFNHVVMLDEFLLEAFWHKAKKYFAVSDPLPDLIFEVGNFFPVLFARVLVHANRIFQE